MLMLAISWHQQQGAGVAKAWENKEKQRQHLRGEAPLGLCKVV